MGVFLERGERRCGEMKGEEVRARKDAEGCWKQADTVRWTAKVEPSQLVGGQSHKNITNK